MEEHTRATKEEKLKSQEWRLLTIHLLFSVAEKVFVFDLDQL